MRTRPGHDEKELETFKKSAMEAAAKWKFKPATQNGKPIAQKNYHLKITFKCKETDCCR